MLVAAVTEKLGNTNAAVNRHNFEFQIALECDRGLFGGFYRNLPARVQPSSASKSDSGRLRRAGDAYLAGTALRQPERAGRLRVSREAPP